MSKAVGINWKNLKDSKSAAFAWFVLALMYFAISFFVVGVDRWEFPYGILYGVGFLAVSIVLAAEKPGFLAGLMAAAIPALATFVSIGEFNANVGMGVGFAAFAVLLANEYEIVEWKAKTVGAKYLMFAPFMFWIIWVATYLWTHSWSLPMATLLNHVGVGLLAVDGILRLGGVYGSAKKAEKQQALKWIGLGATVIGALWLTIVLGWGLQLMH